MKTIKYISLLILIMVTGCGEDWLTLDPQGKKFETNFYQTEDEIFQGLVAAYSMLQTKYFTAWSSYYLLANFPGDDSEVVGGGPNDRPEYHDINDFTMLATNSAILQFWKRDFYGIYRANVVIANANEEASAKSKEYVAEARFLRAYFYAELVKFFGDVPLIISNLSPDEYNQIRTPAEEVYARIIEDLEKAIPNLPLKSALTSADNYRATREAAQALLGKVYLFMASPFYQEYYDFEKTAREYYQLAADQFEAVIALETYHLEPNYDDIWQLKCEHGIESIFEIEYANIERAGDWGNGRVNGGNIDVQLGGPRGISTDTMYSGWGFDMVSQDLIDAYNAEGDAIRRDATAYGEAFLTSIGASGWEKNEGYTGWFSKKRAPWAYLTSSASAEWNYETNERMIRYADVLLMYAEALVNLGTGDPLTSFNEVHTRAGLDPLISVSMNDIKKERRLELAMEGFRFFDLIRWGDAPAILADLGFVQGKHEVFPIPQEEIDNSDNSLIQNPNY